MLEGMPVFWQVILFLLALVYAMWGIAGYIIGYYSWRIAVDKLDKVSSILDHNSKVLETLSARVDVFQRLDDLSVEIRRIKNGDRS